MNRNNKYSGNMSFCGMMTAISVVLVLMMRILPFNKMVLLFGMSLVMCIITQRAGVLWATGSFAVTSFLMFFLTGRYVELLEYFILFGSYPIVKYIIENKIANFKTDKLIKSIYFIVIGCMFFYIADKYLGGEAVLGKWCNGGVAKKAFFVAMLVIAE